VNGQNHIEIDCHVIRDKIQAGVLHFPVASKHQLADMLIKLLRPCLFITLHSKFEIIDIHSAFRGDFKV